MKKTTTSRWARAAGTAMLMRSPGEMLARAAPATAALPPDDQQAVDRAAGEGMIGAPAEATTIAPQHIEGQGHLLASDGTPVARVMADLHVDCQGWAGSLMLPSGSTAASNAARFCLRLDDGRGGRLTVRYRDGAVFLVEGYGPFEPAVDCRPPGAFVAAPVANGRNQERSIRCVSSSAPTCEPAMARTLARLIGSSSIPPRRRSRRPWSTRDGS